MCASTSVDCCLLILFTVMPKLTHTYTEHRETRDYGMECVQPFVHLSEIACIVLNGFIYFCSYFFFGRRSCILLARSFFILNFK